MLRRVAILFILLSLLFMLGHSFTVHSHKSLESDNTMHQHQDFADFISCLFSIDLGQSHLENFVSSRESSISEIQNLAPDLALKAIVFLAVFLFVWKNSPAKRMSFTKKQAFFQSHYFSLLIGRAPPISFLA